MLPPPSGGQQRVAHARAERVVVGVGTAHWRFAFSALVSFPPRGEPSGSSTQNQKKKKVVRGVRSIYFFALASRRGLAAGLPLAKA